MSDFLGNLAARALGAVPTVRPRPASLFEPVTAAAASPTEAFDVWDAAPAPMPTAPPRLLPEPSGVRPQPPVPAAVPLGEPHSALRTPHSAIKREALTDATDLGTARPMPSAWPQVPALLASEHRLTDEQPPTHISQATQPSRGGAVRTTDVAHTRAAETAAVRVGQGAAETAAIREAVETATIPTPHSALRTPHSSGTAVQLAGSSESRILQSLDATAQPIRNPQSAIRNQAVAAGESSVSQNSEATPQLIRTPHSALRTQSVVAQPQVRAYTPPAAEADRGQAQGQVEPTIHVTIGRIEVRATPQPSGARPRQPTPAPALSLEDYLSGRGGGRR
ncbi:MAG: hypothetical protein ACR2M0_08060 [Chloroflexia bacterium]